MSSAEIYKKLREAAEECGFVSEVTAELLETAADCMAEDPRNAEEPA